MDVFAHCCSSVAWVSLASFYPAVLTNYSNCGQSQVPTVVVSAGLSGALATCHSRPRTRQGLTMMDLVPDIVLEVGGFKNLC